MPNVGRPSRGCANCRARKVKCDLKRPSCSQCIRAGKECHGYRDPLSMMFKNESDVVAKKAEKRYEVLAKQKTVPQVKKTYPATPESDEMISWTPYDDWSPSDAPDQMVPYSRYPTPESIKSPMIPSIEDQAQGFFIANYVSKPSIVPRGQFEWVLELLAQPDADETFQRSVKAASLAAFANATKSPLIMQQAQAEYGSALHMTNTALRTQATAVKDTTLIAVIMLGMYENYVMQDKRSIQAWQRHVDGACTLFKIRGHSQFQSQLARRIFHQFYGVALLIALETGSAVHPGMQELYDVMTPSSDYTVHGRQFTTKMINILHDAINLNHDKNLDPQATVSKALRIDGELDQLKAVMPKVWDFDTIRLTQPSEHLYGDTYHIFLDPWIAQMWNNLNICRLYLYKVVRQSIAKGWTEYNPPLFSQERYDWVKTRTEDVLKQCLSATVASVPQIVGMIPFPDLTTAKRRASNASVDEEPKPAPILYPPGTYLDPSQSTHMVHLIWPLYAAGQMDLATPEMRQWAINILHYIALRIGTRQAIVLADELKEVQRTKRDETTLPYHTPSVMPSFEYLDVVPET